MSAADLIHGGALDAMRRAFPDAPEPWIDLSTGINPWSYPTASVAAEDWTRLPTTTAVEACAAAMAKAFGANRVAVLPVAGTELAIRLLPLVVPARRIAIVGPTYDDHRRSWQAAGRMTCVNQTLDEAMREADAVVLCNPNNPDGRTVERDEVIRAAEAMAARGGWLVVDEAYADLRPDVSVAPRAGAPGLIVLRSFGKFYGLGGVRLGAVLAPAEVLEPFAALLGGWNVSGPALRLGARAHADAGWQNAMRQKLARAAATLDVALVRGGLEVAGGTALFRVVRHAEAAAFWERFAQAGIYVRRFADQPHMLRIGLPGHEDALDRLALALQDKG